MYFQSEVEVDIDTIIYEMEKNDKQVMMNYLWEDDVRPEVGVIGWQPSLLMDDPVVRLDAIDYLRKNGWKVEPE